MARSRCCASSYGAVVAILAASALGAMAVELRPRPILPGSIATFKAAALKASGGGGSANVDNQTMTAVLDARRAMLSAANESRAVVRPNRDADDEDAVGQGDGESDGGHHGVRHHGQHPTAAAASSEEDDQGDEHRPQNHRVVDPNAVLGGDGHYAPSGETEATSDQYGYEGPTRHIHIHQHHLDAAGGTVASHTGPSASGGASSASSGLGLGARRPSSPTQTPGLSHYRANGHHPHHGHSLLTGPSGPSASAGASLHHAHHAAHAAHAAHAYKPIKFEEPHHQQQYSVHEDQDHHYNPPGLHSAIAAAHPVHSEAGEATGELAVGVGLGAGLAEGLGGNTLASSSLGGGALGGGGGEGGLQYPLLGAAPYDHPKVLPHAVEPLSFAHHPKKGKAHSLWRSALRVVAGLAPLALLVAAIHPNVLVIDPRLGTRQRSAEGRSALLCEQRAVCEVAKGSGPHALHALIMSLPPAKVQLLDLGRVAKAVELDACAQQFRCDEYDDDTKTEASAASSTARMVTNGTTTATLVTPGPPAVATTTPMMATTTTTATTVRRVKERKRKKFGVMSTSTTTASP